MPDPTPMTETQMLARCARAVDKIDRHGQRGTGMVTWDEIEALAAYVVATGGLTAARAARDHLNAAAGRTLAAAGGAE